MNYRNLYKKITALIILLAFVLGSVLSSYPVTAQAAINRMVNYQGKLTNTSNLAVADGLYNMEFKLYTQLSGGVAVWTETLTTTNRVQVTNGLFSVMLGSTTPFTGVDWNQTLYLGVNVESDGEMTPRKIIGAVPAAFVADTLDNLSSEQFLRSDASNSTSTASTFLTFVQSGAGKIAEFFGQASASVLSLLSNGNVGIGTTTPYAKLSVAGEVVASHFTATTTATSTFGGSIAVTEVATSSFAGGINLTAGCFAINNTCVEASTYGDTNVNAYIHASTTIPKTYTANVFTGLQRFFNASSSLFSIFDRLYVGGTATTTIQGNTTGTSTLQGFLNVVGTNSTSTFSGGLQATNLNLTGSATSTTVNGINLSGGCFSVSGTCVGSRWTASGGDIYYSTGNVGIGTSSPYAKLSVQGETFAEKFTSYSSTASSTFAGGVTIGNVLIPSFKLDVMGTARFEGAEGVIDAPSFNSPNLQSGSSLYSGGDTVNYRAYSYKIVNGITYYSVAFTDSGIININSNGDTVGITYVMAPGADGIRTFIDYNGGGFFDYRDGTSFTDDGNGWTPGEPSTDAIPLARSNTLLAGYNDGTTLWSAYGNKGAYFGGNVGVGTTSPSAALAVTGGFFTTATSTGMNGINLTSGCFSINNVCVGGGGSYGDTNVNAYIHASTTIPKTYTANLFTGLQSFLNASSSLFSIFDRLYVGGTATTTIQGNTTGTSTLQGFLNVMGTNSTSTFNGNLAVLGTTTASTTLSNRYTDNNRWLSLNELASTRAWNRFGQVNPLVSTTTFHTPTNYYLATSSTNLTSALVDLSGVTYYPRNNSIMVVRNTVATERLYEFTLEGTLLRTITLSGFTDTEGVTWMYDDWFAFAEEQGTGVTWIQIAPTATTITRSNGIRVDTSSLIGTGNLTLEGIAYDPDRDVFYISKEGSGTTLGVYQLTRSGVLTTLFATSTFQTNGIGDISDIYYDRNTQHLFFAVDQCYNQANGGSSTLCDGVIEVTLEGQILDKIAAPTGFTQVEGVGFTPDGANMFMFGEPDMYAWYKYQERGPLTFAQTSTTTSVNLGIGTTSPVSTLSVKGTAGANLLTVSSSTNAVLLTLLQNGNFGVGTSSPYAKLSVSGSGVFEDFVRASYFLSTSTATSTFVGGLNVDLLNVSSSTASSTFANGINLATGCFAINGVCIGGAAGSSFAYLFPSNATSTALSFTGGLTSYASTTIGNGTQQGGLTISGGATTTGNAYVAGNLGVGTTSPMSKLSVTGSIAVGATSLPSVSLMSTGTGGRNYRLLSGDTAINAYAGRFVIVDDSAGIDRLVIGSTGNIGIGTTSPYAKLSVVGEVVASHFTATTTATSTFAGGIQTNLLNVTSATASSTFANGINLTAGCFAINGACVGGAGGSYTDTNANAFIHASTTIPKTYTANLFTGLQNFLNASSTLLSVSDRLYVGGTATTTIQGNTTGTSTLQGFLNVMGTNSTSTFSGGLQATNLNLTGSATSTSVNGINLSGGCFAINNVCVGGGGPGGGVTSVDASGGTTGLTFTGGPITNSGTLTLGGVLTVANGGTGWANINAGYIPFGNNGSALATSTNFFWDNTNSRLGIGTSSPMSMLAVAGLITANNINATSTTATSTFSGGLVGNGLSIFDNLEIGNFTFDVDAGAVSWMDLPISSAAPSGTVESYSAQIDSNSLFTIYGEANGAGLLTKARSVFGTTTNTVLTSTNIPYGSVLISDGALCVDNGAGNTCASSARTRGGIYAETSSVSGLDLAEIYPTVDPTLGAGELLMLDPERKEFVKRYTVTASSTPELFGVVSSDPGLILGGFTDDKVLLGTKVPIALAGRVPVKITLENGPIKIGDQIAPSSLPGVAMKADATSEMTIGSALENFDENSTTTSISVFVDVRKTNAKQFNSLATRLSLLEVFASSTLSSLAHSSSTAVTAPSGGSVSETSSVDLASIVELASTTATAVTANAVQNFLASTTVLDGIASSTATTLASSTSFIASISSIVTDIVTSIKEWVVDKITARIAIIDRVETKTVSVQKGFEIMDQATNEIYCVIIKNGQWDMTLGECDAPVAGDALTDDFVEEASAAIQAIPSSTTTPAITPAATTTETIINPGEPEISSNPAPVVPEPVVVEPASESVPEATPEPVTETVTEPVSVPVSAPASEPAPSSSEVSTP